MLRFDGRGVMKRNYRVLTRVVNCVSDICSHRAGRTHMAAHSIQGRASFVLSYTVIDMEHICLRVWTLCLCLLQ